MERHRTVQILSRDRSVRVDRISQEKLTCRVDDITVVINVQRTVSRIDRLRRCQGRLQGEKAMPGPHVSELGATHLQTGIPAALASTGQQKALLIAVVLAHARLQQRRLGRPPLMLLDDVAAHLDVGHRLSLFEAVNGLGAQSWFSGTDIDDFNGLLGQAQIFQIACADSDDGSAMIEVM